MADTELLQLIIKAKGDFDKTFSDYIEAQKKAQEESEKNNNQNKKNKISYGELADQVGKTSTVLARSADAFGLPANALRTLDDVMDVAEIGLNNLSKSAAGFNAASIGVAGAGFAIGTAIGTWLNTFPAVQKAADDAVRALQLLVTGIDSAEANFKAMRGSGADAALTLEQFSQKYGELDKQLRARRPMVTDDEIAKLIKAREETKLLAQAQEILGRQANTLAEAQKTVAFAEAHSEEAKRKAAEAAKQRFEEQVQRDQITQQAYERSLAEAIRMEEELKKIAEIAAKNNPFEADAAKKMREEATEFIKAKEAEERAMEAMNQKVKEDADVEKAAAEMADENADAHERLAQSISHATDEVLGLLDSLIDLPNAFESATSSASGFRNLLGGAHVGANLGSQIGSFFGPMGGAIGRLGGAVVGGIAGLFGGGEGKKVNDMRDQFIEAAGGFDELNKKAHEAGITLDHLLHAGKVKDFEAAVKEVNAALEQQAKEQQDLLDFQRLQADATEKVKDAMQRYNIEVSEAGPTFRQQQLDEQAASLLQDYQLLIAAGVQNNVVIERMGPALVDYVNTARQAGAAIPESMRGIVEQLIREGKLLDDNGNAFGSAEEAGISFAESVSEAMGRAADEIHRLVNALLGIRDVGPINIPVTVGGGGGGNSGPFVPDLPSFGGGGTADWPMGQPGLAELHGGEHVFNDQQLEAVISRAISSAMAQSGRGETVQVFIGGEQLVPTINRLKDAGWVR